MHEVKNDLSDNGDKICSSAFATVFGWRGISLLFGGYARWDAPSQEIYKKADSACEKSARLWPVW